MLCPIGFHNFKQRNPVGLTKRTMRFDGFNLIGYFWDCKKNLHKIEKRLDTYVNCVRIDGRRWGGGYIAATRFAHGRAFLGRLRPMQENRANVFFLALG